MCKWQVHKTIRSHEECHLGQCHSSGADISHSCFNTTTMCLYTPLLVPCPHTDLQATLNCSTDSALISWTPGRGNLIYNATAEGFDVNQKVSCSTPGSACNVSNLHCGSIYQVSVSGEGLTCPSQSDDWIALKSGNNFISH